MFEGSERVELFRVMLVIRIMRTRFFLFAGARCRRDRIIILTFSSISSLVIWVQANHACCINSQKKNVWKSILSTEISLEPSNFICMYMLISSYGRLSPHDWCRVRNKNHRSRWTKNQTSNMGYSGSRTIQGSNKVKIRVCIF